MWTTNFAHIIYNKWKSRKSRTKSISVIQETKTNSRQKRGGGCSNMKLSRRWKVTAQKVDELLTFLAESLGGRSSSKSSPEVVCLELEEKTAGTGKVNKQVHYALC